ncbi:FecR family protein [Mariniphaga anaerophila]|uniref:FecR family protein n=1 Tax=Mariniphaga anaerophila TaxID=1484053 RepID=A0A1M4W2L9_9BACT|nr:FecR domain-containing protein [Mariniphaga anaerophila]SHE75405.1 FecR family protein [Mariniphaga anaerophila]
MDINNYKNYSTEDFVLDDNFMEWVLHPNQSNEKFWNEFIKNNPDKKHQVEEAVFIIKSFQVTEPSVSNERLETLYRKAPLSFKSGRIIGWRFARIAAILFFILSIGSLTYFLQLNNSAFPIKATNTASLAKGKVILPDGTVTEFETEQTKIQQILAGGLTINNDTVVIKGTEKKPLKHSLIQVVVPYGKRSEITLADGTRVWLNSGSHFSYPSKFDQNIREVYLTGEAFLDVKANQDSPFYVITEDVKVKVTGTRFNVTSYAGEDNSQVVLLSGKIDASRNKRFARSIEVNPGERVVYNKTDNDLAKDKVDVELYTSWIDGYIIFNNEPVENILKKLERYYNEKIFIGELSSHVKFSGKLNLADDLEKVLKNIGYSASFSVRYENDAFFINQ